MSIGWAEIAARSDVRSLTAHGRRRYELGECWESPIRLSCRLRVPITALGQGSCEMSERCGDDVNLPAGASASDESPGLDGAVEVLRLDDGVGLAAPEVRRDALEMLESGGVVLLLKSGFELLAREQELLSDLRNFLVEETEIGNGRPTIIFEPGRRKIARFNFAFAGRKLVRAQINYGWSAMEGPQPIKPEQGRADADPPGADRAAAHDRLQRHRRVRLPRQEVPRAARGLRLRRLGNAAACGPPASRATGPRRCRRSRARRCASSPSARTRTASCTSSTTTAARSTRIERNDGAPGTPTSRRSCPQTGLFASVKDHTPAAGVIPFAVNSRQWQDGATAEHWVAFPGDVVRHPARDRQADPRPGVLAQLPHALPEGRGAGEDPLPGRPAAGDAAPALRRRGLARVHVRLARRSGGRRPGPRRRRREGGAHSATGASRSASGSSTAAASACRATATSRNTRWRSFPSN